MAASPGAPRSLRGQKEIGINKVLLVGRLTRDPEPRTLPSGKAVANVVVATNEFHCHLSHDTTNDNVEELGGGPDAHPRRPAGAVPPPPP